MLSLKNNPLFIICFICFGNRIRIASSGSCWSIDRTKHQLRLDNRKIPHQILITGIGMLVVGGADVGPFLGS